MCAGELLVTWGYSPSAHDAATVERLAAEHLGHVRALTG
ncbi:hypothetical protein CLV40_11379 [Actinokineospora auranticolor]|uniref:Uncharacterized protein n=1 Tax=Actinokineospora auranticolor TaxID=155976 RepID=A0A2S6GK59_9PSEU|nr:hypothetical protein CLV40_11379 [Actinokineospora auranticolor]